MTDSNICAELHAGITTATAAGTQAVASRLAAALPADTVIALHGDLGVGKTTFVQGLAAGFGIRGHVTSPTFNIFTLYRGARTLVHLDAYRLEHARQIEELMLEDFLVTPWCLAVEWPSRIDAWIPADAWHIELGILPDESHTIRLR